jgi:hypothetical protein
MNYGKLKLAGKEKGELTYCFLMPTLMVTMNSTDLEKSIGI